MTRGVGARVANMQAHPVNVRQSTPGVCAVVNRRAPEADGSVGVCSTKTHGDLTLAPMARRCNSLDIHRVRYRTDTAWAASAW